MRHVRGYVCVAPPSYQPGIEILFGRNTESHDPPYRNFETNNLTPYGTKSEAEKGKRALRELPTFPRVRIARISMTVIEKDKDLEQLTGKAFVAIQLSKDFPGEAWLYGRRVKGRPGFDSRSMLCENGMKPYSKRADAYYAAREIQRQACTRAAVASFELKYVSG